MQNLVPSFTQLKDLELADISVDADDVALAKQAVAEAMQKDPEERSLVVGMHTNHQHLKLFGFGHAQSGLNYALLSQNEQDTDCGTSNGLPHNGLLAGLRKHADPDLNVENYTRVVALRVRLIKTFDELLHTHQLELLGSPNVPIDSVFQVMFDVTEVLHTPPLTEINDLTEVHNFLLKQGYWPFVVHVYDQETQVRSIDLTRAQQEKLVQCMFQAKKLNAQINRNSFPRGAGMKGQISGFPFGVEFSRLKTDREDRDMRKGIAPLSAHDQATLQALYFSWNDDGTKGFVEYDPEIRRKFLDLIGTGF